MEFDSRSIGSRYSVRIAYTDKGTAKATMSKRGCKTTWQEIGANAEEARDLVLRYLDERVRPFVSIVIS